MSAWKYFIKIITKQYCHVIYRLVIYIHQQRNPMETAVIGQAKPVTPHDPLARTAASTGINKNKASRVRGTDGIVRWAPVSPPSASHAHQCNQKIYKINKSMFASLCLVDAEIEMKGELSERTIDLVRSILATIVEDGAA